jgi:hypothetical protein
MHFSPMFPKIKVLGFLFINHVLGSNYELVEKDFVA